VPLHVPERPLGVATRRPLGNVSVKPTPVSDDAFGLLMVKLSDVDCPILIDVAPNVLLIDGGEGAFTPIEAFAVLPVPASLEVTAEVTLFCAPVLAPLAVTLTENVQLVFAAKVAFDRTTLPVPAVAVGAVPLHVPDRPLGVATIRPAGTYR
jgi:hypothetical protein